jgi:hypothetical protein
MNTQLRKDVADVNAGGLAADEQGIGYLLVGAPVGHEAKDLELAGGEARRTRAPGQPPYVETAPTGQRFDTAA